MDVKMYLGCLGILAFLAIASGASVGAVGLLVASKFIGLLVLVAIGVVVLWASQRR